MEALSVACGVGWEERKKKNEEIPFLFYVYFLTPII